MQKNNSSRHELLHKITELVPGLVAVYNIHTGEYLYVNSSVKKILGYTKEEFLDGGLPFVASLVHPDDVGRIFAENNKALEKANKKSYKAELNDPIVNFEYRMKDNNGSWHWLHTDGVIFERNEKGNVEVVMNISVDITKRKEREIQEAEERKKAQDELQRSKDQLEIIIQNIADGITVQDITGKIIYANDAAAKATGYRSVKAMATLTHKDYESKFTMFGENGQPFPYSNLPGRRALAGEKNPSVIVKYIDKKTKEVHWSIIKSTAVYDSDKNPYLVINVITDITQRKEMEERKDDFMNMASHELKTPLTSARVFAQVLKNRFTGSQDLQAKKFIEKIDQQLTKLTELVQELLDVTRMQKGRLTIKKQQFFVRELVEEVAEDLQPTTTHALIIDWHTKMPVYADRERIRQVLTNLVTNAIKYSPENKEVILSSQKKGEMIIVKVQDFGLGIPQDQQKKIFDRFYQVTEYATYPGLGLGLYISSEIIKQHGGKIWVESTLGKGSTFCFSLPLKS